MAANTPWCPRCGAWRGHIAPLCKGCVKIENGITPEMLAGKKAALIAAAGLIEDEALRTQKVAAFEALGEAELRPMVLRELVQARFIKISEMRTDREAYTQTLEEMVERNIDTLKSVCYDWMRMRPESRRVRFSNMFALEMVQVARAALEEVGALSLELSRYTENKARHEETMERVTAGMQAVEKFVYPDGNDPADPPIEEEPTDGEDEDKTPGSTV